VPCKPRIRTGVPIETNMVTPIMTTANDESCLVTIGPRYREVLEETLYAEREWSYVQGTFVFTTC
jgi:hypothetical protein